MQPEPKKIHARTVVLPAPVDAALVKAAAKEGRSARAHAAKLIAVALGFACLALACSGAPESPVEGSEERGGAFTDAGPSACPPVGASLAEQCGTVDDAGWFCVNPCDDAGTSCCYESVCGRAVCPKP